MLSWKFFGAACCASLALTAASREAGACGGCFHGPVSQSRSTQVTGHRMALSLSNTRSTLWDQIQYVGDPTEFAWVLPIRGPVEVGVSSDAMFSQLEALTTITISSGAAYCDQPSFGSGGTDDCNHQDNATNGSGGGTGGTSVDDVEANPVEVIAQEVVGPYETVQLSSADPLALRTWLTDHGYELPVDIEPIVDAYVAEGFDFLAIRLVPGVGVTAMRPIRVTTPGPTLTLPLRMVAAGTGAMTAVSLFVVSEGMYVPSSAPWGTLYPFPLVWDFDAGRSNYAELRKAFFYGAQFTGWLLEAHHPLDATAFAPLSTLAGQDPANSGYGEADGAGAQADAQEDIARMIGDLVPTDTAITHLTAELGRPALEKDLVLQGVAAQVMPRELVCNSQIGDPCNATPLNHCGDFGTGGGDGLGPSGGSSAGCACDLGGPTASTGGALLVLGLGLATARRRTRRSGVRGRGSKRDVRPRA